MLEPSIKDSSIKASSEILSKIPSPDISEILSKQKIQKFIEEKKEMQNIFLTYIDNTEEREDDFQILVSILDVHQKNREFYNYFLNLIANIADKHHRSDCFFQRIFKILKYLQDEIKQIFSNLDIFNIFNNNKTMLLFLFENKIISFDNHIFFEIMKKPEINGDRYCYFLYPEIKEFLGEQESKFIEGILTSKDPNIMDKYNEKRHESENDSYICSLIRKDSVVEFISYVNKTCVSLKSEVKPSIFETNSFLIENKPTLIEYSAFFGSIQIFQYLLMNEVELNPSLWLYAIHSNNPELIHLLEYYKVNPPNMNYNECFIESIKCHHNEMANYFNDKITENDHEIFSNILKYHNYEFLPTDFKTGSYFYYLYTSGYHELVDLFMEINKIKIDPEINDHTKKKYANSNSVEYIYYMLLKEKSIKECSFSRTQLRQIAIPSSIISIEASAFYCCSITKIVTPPSVTYISNSSFACCTSLEEAILNSVVSIGHHAFHRCKSLKIVKIPLSIESIDYLAFWHCKSITQIAIPSSINYLGYNAFEDCPSMTLILNSPDFKSFKKDAFQTIKYLDIIGNSKYIPKHLCSVFSNLTKVTILLTVTSIREFAFSGCSSLKEITIPSTVTSIGDFAFSECSSLKQINIPSEVNKIGCFAFYKCSSLKQVVIPSFVSSIQRSTFSNCYSLVYVTIPSFAISVEFDAFENCSNLKKISIHESM